VDNRFGLTLTVLVFATLGAVWLLMPARLATHTPRFRGSVPHGDTLRFRRCRRDDECVAARNGCCDCNNGSATLAVRRDMEAAFKKSFACTGGCTEMGGPPCWEGTVRCEDGRCEFEWAHRRVDGARMTPLP
jgi:hypothetical protein